MSGQPLLIGVTGAIGAGKSSVLQAFALRGCACLSADAVVHTLYHQSRVRDVVVARFGEQQNRQLHELINQEAQDHRHGDVEDAVAGRRQHRHEVAPRAFEHDRVGVTEQHEWLSDDVRIDDGLIGILQRSDARLCLRLQFLLHSFAHQLKA